MSVAFLHAEILDPIAIVPPVELREAGFILDLAKAMNGTRQASLCFSRLVEDVFVKENVMPIRTVPQVYMDKEEDSELAVHGDDFLGEGDNSRVGISGHLNE